MADSAPTSATQQVSYVAQLYYACYAITKQKLASNDPEEVNQAFIEFDRMQCES